MAQPIKKNALGKGIRALLDTIDEDLQGDRDAMPSVAGQSAVGIFRIPVEQIEMNPKQPRRDFDEVTLLELAGSIKSHDVIQPITVVKTGQNRYQLISGERRMRAAKMAGLKDIPAYVRTAESHEMLEMALLENLQRQDLNAIEIALSYRQLMDECSLTQEQVAERMKKERSTVANFLRLLKLPPDIQKSVRDGHLTMGHARAIIALIHVEQQLYVFREIIDKGLSVRQVEQLVKDMVTEKPVVAKNPTPSKLPMAYKKLEDNIASYFSTKVTLQRKKTGKGTIEIEFYNDEDLERIMEKLNL